MASLEFNYQVGIPTATFPTSLTVTSSAAGVSINSFAPTHKYVAFGLVGTPPTPPPPPLPGYLLWTPVTETVSVWASLTGGVFYPNYTFEQFQTVDPTDVSIFAFSSNQLGPSTGPSYTTSISNFTPYTNLTALIIYGQILSEIDFEDIILVPNASVSNDPVVQVANTYSLTAINNLPKNAVDYYLNSNNLLTTSVDNVLIELDNYGDVNGFLDLTGSYMSPPSPTGINAKNNLVSKGWSVSVNESVNLLDSNDNSFTSINYFIYNNVTYNNQSINSFNSIVGNDVEGVTQIAFNPSMNLNIDYLDTYKNINLLSMPDNNAITNVNLQSFYGLTNVNFLNCSNLQALYLPPYYKNLTAVVFQGCALGESSVNQILDALDRNGKQNGEVFLNLGTSQPPSYYGITAKNNLIAKGWDVVTN